jgi:hypothetical protein
MNLLNCNLDAIADFPDSFAPFFDLKQTKKKTVKKRKSYRFNFKKKK